MTMVIDTGPMSRIGVTLVDSICARARQVFRETPHTDVGLDGQIEFVDDNRASGVFLGVQVKTGPSYIGPDAKTFAFTADQAHFAYWASCSMPVIAVIVDPAREIAAWADLSALCTRERIASGPYKVEVELSADTQFTIDALTRGGAIRSVANKYSQQRFTLWQYGELLRAKGGLAPTIDQRDGAADTTRRTTWNMLSAEFLSTSSSENLLNVGQRLSWHYPSVPDEFRKHLNDELRRADASQVARWLAAVTLAIESDRPDVGEAIGDLMEKVPTMLGHLKTLLDDGCLPRQDKDSAIQLIEGWMEDEATELREKCLGG